MTVDHDAWRINPCSDHGCILRGPEQRGGMGTNGGCEHLKTHGPEANRMIKALAKEIVRLRAELERRDEKDDYDFLARKGFDG